MKYDATRETDNGNAGGDDTKPDFVAELTPHRSLGPNGFLLLMLLIGSTCFISGIMFLVIGAWPVFVFFGLDILIIFIAFKINYRDGRAKERVSIDRDVLKIEQFDPAGRVKEHVFNPYWSRFVVDRHEEFGITKMQIASQGNSLTIGSFLNPIDRESFAVAFNQALIRAKS